MDFGEPIRELGDVDADALRTVILAQEDAVWREQQERQDSYEVHRQTESIVMVFTDNKGWPNIEVRKEAGWHRLAEQAIPLMHDIIERHYAPGGTIVRAMAAKLLAGGRISTHRDTHPSFHYGHRIHVPVSTNPRVRFYIDGRPYRLQVGQAYEINNQKYHSVYNKGRDDRITFIFDYMPPDVVGLRQSA
ncbi:MAG TPA: aspartyl/asparaginyl beta-hydroxylase domain-containing protein [Woeseiaceae bacterium]|nr:aspartyl/asparaginyl beta-hydroxylase domain-containing protein [Woeseiaceae bacterium]